ncbi:MAG: hypothetical protein CVT92_10935 [Bacteroidetes bacterium HGW-Bacteroidetes-1]|jgi:Fe-S cluster assembly iron-binding protein IscA|nr:MAG: hypothetical protein CVT92_10935 [Bacteroidetes bacterium HGW-Bacteroidetes-1]
MQITAQAHAELKKVLDGYNRQGAGIHIFSTHECCGPSIQMDIANQAVMNETVISLEGIEFYVTNDLLAKVEEVTIEFSSNGFRLAGLNKTSSGCC